MYRYSYLSKLTTLIAACVLFVISMGCTNMVSPENMADGIYVILPYDYDSKDDVRWSQYLYDHLRRRGGDDSPVYYDFAFDNSKEIIFRLDRHSSNDFKIENSEKRLYLTAKNESSAVWLIHQYMRFVGDTDKRFPYSDLPASILSFKDTTGNFAFKYREVYTPLSHEADINGVLGLNSIDGDWGLWGHNLKLVVKDKEDKNIYASVDGMTNYDQYCFSSNTLYENIVQYITSNYGEVKQSINFAIFPNDNNLVCTCNSCKSAGNTPGNATPAVTKMIRRLADRFKQHTFFTSAYLTTKSACKKKLPKNVGVIISAIDWEPGKREADKSRVRLEKIIDDWREHCNCIYVWDYMNNYDDYFSPYPMLGAMKERLMFYKKKEVKGVFLNGSGYEYSLFSDMHTNVLAALMMNPTLDVKRLVTDFFVRTYPKTGLVIADYYCNMLDRVKEKGKPMPFYGGIKEKMNVYIDAGEFERFYKEITRLKSNVSEEEAYKLRKLITALTFTRLEIARHCGYGEYGYATLEGNTITLRDEIKELLDIYEDGYKAFELFKINESGDKSELYAECWREHILSEKKIKNILFGKKLLVEHSGKSEKLSELTDGEPGLPVNYYYGWNIFPYREIDITIPVDNKLGEINLTMNLFSYLRHRIQLPSKIEIYSNGKLINSEDIKKPNIDGPYQIKWKKRINRNRDIKDNIKLKIFASSKYHIAIDEIRLTE